MSLPKARLPKASSNLWDVLHSKHGSTYAEKVMDEQEWERHRCAGWRHRPRPWLFVRFLLGSASILFWVAVFSAAVGLYDVTLVRRYGWPMLTIQCVQTFFGAITFALTLLLVFKTNASYNRWTDARRATGMLTSTAHNLARQAVAFFPAHQAQLTAAMLRWTAASMWAVKFMVRPHAPLRDELKNVLLPCELSWLMDQPHKPLAVGQALSTILQSADIDMNMKARMDVSVTTYVYEWGGCRRIYATAIPIAYTRHTSRFLLCYILVGLPLLMWPLASWGAPVLSVAIAFLVLGIENISAFIEEPFRVLTFDAFCQSVTNDMQTVLAMLSTDDDGTLGRPPLSSAAAPKPPVIAGLTAPMDKGSEHMGGSRSPAAVLGSTSPDALVDILHVPAIIGASQQYNLAKSDTSAAAAAAASSAPMMPVTAAQAAESRSEELNYALGTLPAASNCTDSYSWATQQQQQQQQQRWGSYRRRSFDVVGMGRHRRPVQHVNSRTNLLSAVSGQSLL